MSAGQAPAPSSVRKTIKDWPNRDIDFLIYEGDEFVVYTDQDIEIDWETTDKYDDDPSQEGMKRHSVILSLAAELECIPNDQHPKSIRKNFKRMIGEGIARSLERQYESADKSLERARQYINNRNVETARYWQLCTACISGVAILIVGLLVWTLRTTFSSLWGWSVYVLALCGAAGALGAVLSMVFRIGGSFPNSESPRKLHIAEALSRVLAGALSGLLIVGAMKIGLILATLGSADNRDVAMALVGMASGGSERFAPSLIAKLSGMISADKPQKEK